MASATSPKAILQNSLRYQEREKLSKKPLPVELVNTESVI